MLFPKLILAEDFREHVERHFRCISNFLETTFGSFSETYEKPFPDDTLDVIRREVFRASRNQLARRLNGKFYEAFRDYFDCKLPQDFPAEAFAQTST